MKLPASPSRPSLPLYQHGHPRTRRPFQGKWKSMCGKLSTWMYALLLCGALVYGIIWTRLSSSGPVVAIDEAEQFALPPPSFLSKVARWLHLTSKHFPPEDCSVVRDHGMIEVMRQSSQGLCGGASSDPPESSSIVYYKHPHPSLAFDATVVRNFVLDLRNARVYKPITDVSQDGSGHDPRFAFQVKLPLCACNDQALGRAGELPSVWSLRFGGDMRKEYVFPVCQLISSDYLSKLRLDGTSRRGNVTIQESSKLIILARRDDHNPFFQISAVMNAWIMMRTLEWNESETQLMYLDDGLPTPTDEFQQRMLSPHRPVIKGKSLIGQTVVLNHALLSPVEGSGPIAAHLNDEEPCGRSEMFADFRRHSLKAMGVSDAKDDPQSCRVTVISRKPYNGRALQRVWMNEEEIVAAMQEMMHDGKKPHRNGACTVESVDFVKLSMADQMRLIVNSDMVIGMHGAGMANVFWSRPNTKVIEIFPRYRRRWGYRNLCQFLGCDWVEFRGGSDTGEGDNESNKSISVSEWMAFFEPLFDARHS